MKARRLVGMVIFVFGLLLYGFFEIAPEHLMHGFTGSAKINGRMAASKSFIGSPTQSEAESLVLIEVEGGGTYFVDLDRESYREVSRDEYVRLLGSVWTWRSMRAGKFKQPQWTDLNQLRVTSQKGQLVDIEL